MPSAIIRPIVSVGPPAGNGTTNRDRSRRIGLRLGVADHADRENAIVAAIADRAHRSSPSINCLGSACRLCCCNYMDRGIRGIPYLVNEDIGFTYAKAIDWDSQIGRRLRLRDLYVFSSVVRLGSMGKAAQELGVSQPAVSEVIADLEHGLGVRLLDRGPQGVSPTVYGVALERRSVAAFDELKQGIKDIEFLSIRPPARSGSGARNPFRPPILQPIIEEFSRQYPSSRPRLDTVNTLSFAQKLRDRESRSGPCPRRLAARKPRACDRLQRRDAL